MHHRDRAAPLALDQLDRAEQRRACWRSRRPRSGTSDLDLRIDADLEPAVELDDVVVVDQRGGVGLLGIDRADPLGLPDRRSEKRLVGRNSSRRPCSSPRPSATGADSASRNAMKTGRRRHRAAFLRARPGARRPAPVGLLRSRSKRVHSIGIGRHVARRDAVAASFRRTRAKAGCRRCRRTGSPTISVAGSPCAALRNQRRPARKPGSTSRSNTPRRPRQRDPVRSSGRPASRIPARRVAALARDLSRSCKLEPKEAVRRERDDVGPFADRAEIACGRASRAARVPATATGRSRRPARSATGWRRRASPRPRYCRT